ncbi:retrotransposon protein, putative, ty1-copia subclass [Tanacetum coccineum]
MLLIAKFDVEKFDGSNNIGLWLVKMRCLLIQHSWEAALDPFPGTMTDADKTTALKTDVYKKAHSALLLHCLMEEGGLTLEDVLSSLNTRELKKRTDAKDDGDGLYVRRRSDHHVEEKFDIFSHSGSRWLNHEVAEWKSKGDQGFFDGFVRKMKEMGVHHGWHGLNCKFKEWKQLVENQNGLAERMNMTLLNKVRSPSTALEKNTPMDLWSGHPAKYEMLRIFGCVAYSHVNQGRLKPRAIKCIFLGYPNGVKGYRLWRVLVLQIFGKEVKFEVELQGGRVESTVDPHTRENLGNKDEEQDEGPQQQNLDNYVLVRDRAKRTTTIPATYRDECNVSLSRPSGLKVDDMAAYAFAISEEEDTHEPITFQEAINSSEKDESVCAMEEEMSSLKKNHFWELADQPPGQKLISCKWLYKIKEGIEGVQKPRYKARLVARGFTQRVGIDYNELEQLDVKTTFLYGNLNETIYIRQPPGFEEATGNKVCLLKKSLYGLKQSSRQWYKRFDVYMISNGFSRNSYDSCVYFKEFALARKILGMEIVRDRGSRTLKVSQSGYVEKILNNYRVDNGKSVSVPLGAHFKVSLKDCPSSDWDVERMNNVPYANAVGSLMYLMMCTRPDIAYAVSIVSRYLANPGKNHWEAVKWILKYLKGTVDVGLVYGRDQGKHVDVDGFMDADYHKDPDKGRSITGYVFMVYGYVVSWKATLQHAVALSTTEAEYMALTEAVKESI